MEQIKIDIVPVGVAPVAHASQFDNGRQIRFNLFNQGTPYTLTGAETVTMVVNGEEENITNTSDNYVIWDVAEEDCETSGVIGCEIRIVLGSMLIGSKNFFLEVEMDPYDGKNIRIITVGPADICTFETTLPEPLQSVLADVVASGGNGTPDNPVPIVGYTEANITANGNTYTISFGQTVYGGVLDVTRGKLTVTHGKYVLDNTATAGQFDINTYTDRNRISYVPYQSDGKLDGTFKADKLETAPNVPGGIGTGDYQIFGSTTAPRMWITVPTTIATAADFLTYISSNPIEVVYELTTPFDIDLTPVQIRAIVGENNVWADCGQSTVKYLAEG